MDVTNVIRKAYELRIKTPTKLLPDIVPFHALPKSGPYTIFDHFPEVTVDFQRQVSRSLGSHIRSVALPIVTCRRERVLH